MYAGQIIEYNVSPLEFLYLDDRNHAYKDKEYFINEQRFGPYIYGIISIILNK